MRACEGKDSRRQPCGMDAMPDSSLCYWHQKVSVGLIREYFVSKNASSEFEFQPVLSTPRPGGGQ